MITQNINEKSTVVYQEWEDENPGEPAIIIQKYTDSVQLIQENNSILISNHELKNFIKALKAFL